MTNNQALGRHILVEAYDCGCNISTIRRGIQGAMIEAAERTGATVVDVALESLSPTELASRSDIGVTFSHSYMA